MVLSIGGSNTWLILILSCIMFYSPSKGFHNYQCSHNKDLVCLLSRKVTLGRRKWMTKLANKDVVLSLQKTKIKQEIVSLNKSFYFGLFGVSALCSAVFSSIERIPSIVFQKAMNKFMARPATYIMIPFIASFVGWFTNWIAVQMIFYPINYVGLDIYRLPEVPLGFLGWQGIIPCKTRKMTESIVKMVTTDLISVPGTFKRLDPRKCADLLAPSIPKLASDTIEESSVNPLIPKLALSTLTNLSFLNKKFVENLCIDLQSNVDKILNLKNCVVEQMLNDRRVLGQLFWSCGKQELNFLTNSGLWFGFLLGIIQMIIALFCGNPWSLSIGGLIVGYATNWLALELIFKPIEPKKFGPFVLQGMFLKRQKEVSATFSNFFSSRVLTSQKLWNSMLTDPTTAPAFRQLFLNRLSYLEPHLASEISSRATSKLPNYIDVLHPYVDETLGLNNTLRLKMEQMPSKKFEQVLHPIFEEDEFTLILAGAILGFAAGLIQQGLFTGVIVLPNILRFSRTLLSKIIH